LRGLFGPPTRTETSKFTDYPTEEWSNPPITIWHLVFERFSEYHVLHIRHRGQIESENQVA
jgi:hypothetical protein